MIRRRNTALASLERFDSGRANAPGLLRVTRGLATPLEGTVGTPIEPHEHAVWVRYVLEELSSGWVEVLSEARPSRFSLSMGEGRAVAIDAPAPKQVVLNASSSRVFGRTPDSEFDPIFDEELPEEIALCGESFAARVEAERSSRDALFRVRIERILEGESVLISGVVTEAGDALRLADQTSGTLLANVPERELTRRPNPILDVVIGALAIVVFGGGLMVLRLANQL